MLNYFISFLVNNFVQFIDSQNFLVYIGLLGKYFIVDKKNLYSYSLIGSTAPRQMYGEGNYALTAVKEVSVTQSFLGLKEEDKKCQNLESLEDCSTRSYLQSIRSDQTDRTIHRFSVGESAVDHSVLVLMKIFRFVPRPSSTPSQSWREQPGTAWFPVREYLLM